MAPATTPLSLHIHLLTRLLTRKSQQRSYTRMISSHLLKIILAFKTSLQNADLLDDGFDMSTMMFLVADLSGVSNKETTVGLPERELQTNNKSLRKSNEMVPNETIISIQDSFILILSFPSHKDHKKYKEEDEMKMRKNLEREIN
nr:hypothetical protein [Tanacetum cinerariifolium]